MINKQEQSFIDRAIEIISLFGPTALTVKGKHSIVMFITEALLKVERETRESAYKKGVTDGIMRSAEIVKNAGREGPNWIRHEILSLLPKPSQEEEK